MKKPNLFIVGAPKCGTTAMHEYLAKNPEIFMSTIKEPHFFGDDLTARGWIKGEREYLGLFKLAKDEQIIGESSICSLYSKSAAAGIKAFSPDARIIIMVRNPTDMLYSLQSELYYSGFDPIADFEKAIADPNRVLLPKSLTYKRMTRYADDVAYYLQEFGREQVQISVYDDFKKNPEGIYRQTLRFLGVEAMSHLNYTVVNPNKYPKNQIVNKLLRTNPPTIVRLLGRTLLPKPIRIPLFKMMVVSNTEYAPRPPMAAELKRRLQEEFAPEVEKLSDVLKRDLSFWNRC